MVAPLAIATGMKALSQSRQFSVSVMGYDFLGLLSRLAVFYLAAFIVNSYFVATIKGGMWLNSIGSLFGMKFPETLPEWVTQLFTTGYKGISFWQIIQIISVLLAVIEYFQYDKMLKLKGETANASTIAVFSIIALSLSLITFPTMIQKFKEMKIING